MAENISAAAFIERMMKLADSAGGAPIATNAPQLVAHLNAFEPTRKALAFIIGVERAKISRTNTLENGVPCITALQLLERMAHVAMERTPPDLTGAEAKQMLIGELAHLSQAALGRVPIVPAEPA